MLSELSRGIPENRLKARPDGKNKKIRGRNSLRWCVIVGRYEDEYHSSGTAERGGVFKRKTTLGAASN